ncbi:uncharacterized protein LOC113795819 [Dermatophagoides pteronyssinus]|uniref:uncharacterized protein LOC113795819 n=1 Tax=Dermatophagoides pteronyssinus TaxID=6956 RepID=UPI003F6761C6
MLFYFKQFNYCTIKYICEQYGTRRYKLLHRFEFFCYIYLFIRLSIIFLMYLDPETFPFMKYDYASEYFWLYRHIINKFLVIIAIMLSLIGMLGLKTFFFHRVDTASFRILYDCIVYNTDQYWKSMDTDENVAIKCQTRYNYYRQQFDREHRYLSMINPLADRLVSIKVWLDSWLELDHLDQELFEKHNRMRLLLYVTNKGRIYVLLFVMMADKLIYWLHIGFVIPGIPVVYIALRQFLSLATLQNSLLMKLSFLLEALIFAHDTFVLIHCAMLLTWTMIISFIAFHNELTELNRNFSEISRKSRANSNNNRISLKEISRLKFIYKRHNIMSYYLIYPDQDAWSQALYYYALLSIPINVSLLCILINEQLSPEIQSILLTLTILHALTGLIPFLTVANVSNDFHRIKDYILPMQFQLKQRQHLRLKLKYDDLYGRLMHGKKISFTFGYLGDLTFRGLFEAFLSYIVAFFLILGFYMDEQQNRQQQQQS